MAEKGSFWISPKWTVVGVIVGGIALIASLVIGYTQIWMASHPDSVGVVKLQRVSASSVIPSEILPESATVLFEGMTIAPGHLQSRTYLLQNLTNHHLVPADFDAPLTAHMLAGEKVLSISVTLPANRPPLKIEHSADTVVIPPMLLNVGESVSVNLLVATPNAVRLFEDPFAGEESVIRWTTEIKGVDFQVTGADPVIKNMFDPTQWGIYILHHGMAIYALLATGVLFSFLQILATARRMARFDLATCVVLAFRVALAWSAAEALVSFADTLLATWVWANWAVVAAFFVSLVPVPKKWTNRLFRRASSTDATI